jgi:antitoxin MazE
MSVKIRTKFQVTIPEDVREKIPLNVGDRVEVIARGSEIVIRPLVEVPRDQAWFWDSDWQELEKQAAEDKEAGKTKSFTDVEKAIKWLKQ